MRYLLDTNVVSHLVHRPHGHVADRIAQVGESRVCTSIVVAAELRYGAAKRGAVRLTTQVEAVLGAMEIAPLEPPVDRVYGEIRARLERKGSPIGGNDLLIAAQALALGCVVVTDNVAEFRRVKGLDVESWAA